MSVSTFKTAVYRSSSELTVLWRTGQEDGPGARAQTYVEEFVIVRPGVPDVTYHAGLSWYVEDGRGPRTSRRPGESMEAYVRRCLGHFEQASGLSLVEVYKIIDAASGRRRR